MASWIPIEDGSDFSLQNLPYGVFSTDDLDQRIGVAIGDYVLDLKALAQEKVFAAIDFDSSTLEEPTINAYASLRKSVHHDVRKLMQDILSESTLLGPVLRDHRDRRDRVLVPLSRAKMHMPMHIGDYTDFFVGLYHAQNVCGNPRLMIFLDALAIANAGGKCCDIFRPGMGLPPNFSSLPVGYHGRASSVVISGTPVHRPRGQIVLNGIPTESLCQKLDFEVEFAAFIGRGNKMGSRIGVNEAEDHIFGVVLMNDWSARDIQQWESTPLGPFNGKNFCTTISPWIVTLEALEPFRTTPLTVDPQLPYLNQDEKESVYDIPIRVSLENDSGTYSVTECNTKHVVFSFAQMLAHHTVGGCPMRPGDLIATGTLSGPTRGELGCLLEATRNGIDPYEMKAQFSGKQNISRAFLEDGDTIEFKAQVQGKSGLGHVGFGACKGKIVASA